MKITAQWQECIDNFAISQRAGGARETTIRTRREHIEWLARRVGCGPWDVTTEMLINLVGQQQWKPETRRSRRASFLEFYRWGKRTKRTKTNPAKELPKIRAEIGAPRPANSKDVDFAMVVADERTLRILRLAYEYGLRRGEIVLVHDHDLVDDLVGTSLVVHGKGGKDRIVPLLDDFARELKRACNGGWAFPGQIDGHLSARRVGELGTEVLPSGLHSLRHSFGTRAYAKEHDLLAVQELLGHSTPTTTRRYVKTPPDALRHTIEAIRAA